LLCFWRGLQKTRVKNREGFLLCPPFPCNLLRKQVRAMSRPNPTVLFGFFVAVIVAICGAGLAKGGFYLGKHEGDTLHMIQIVLRMADGEWPHLDFMTPIGVLAFAPFALFVKLGYGIGMSILLGQTLVSVIFLPAVWWVAFSRMRGMLPYLFGLFVFVLIGALVHGEAQRSVSISMHYNRWSWAVAFLAISTAVIPPKGRKYPLLNGTIVGFAHAALLLTKVTYFAAFAPPVMLALLLRRSFATLAYAVLAGLLIVGVVTAMAGMNFWLEYLRDLLLVATSEVRSNPGEPFSAVVGAPAYLGASLTAITGIILLRQSREAIGGLILLLLVPGFFYVTYQNFGNDPQWLLLLAVLLLAFLPERDIRNGLGWEMRSALKITAAVALALAIPSFFNLAYSPFRHLRVKTEDYTQLLPRASVHSDIYATKLRATRADARIPLPAQGTPLVAYEALAGRDEPTVFQGETLPVCELTLGLSAWFDAIVSDLDEAGLAKGKRLFAADLFSSHWLFGPLEPLKNGAPWYYGGLPGIQSADYLLVPLCPVTPRIRDQILKEVEKSGRIFTEIRRTPLYVLYVPS
jgi:hypothetical protein